ncbi:MAG TPA: flagellar biosynthetic protein FliO [Candidatus Acidoferrum sp.]|nr:flagellar biosynthetic protein FliO [Candidatus Acidoferrum sp.]
MSDTPIVSLRRYTLRLAERLCQLFRTVSIRRRERSLRLCETVSLGDKRFVAVVQFERRRFLLGVTPHSVSLLQGLGDQDHPSTGQLSTTTHEGAI